MTVQKDSQGSHCVLLQVLTKQHSTMLNDCPRKYNSVVTENWSFQVYEDIELAKQHLQACDCKYLIYIERNDDGPSHLDVYIVFNGSVRATGVRTRVPMAVGITAPHCASYMIVDYLKEVSKGIENGTLYEKGQAPRRRRPSTVFTVMRERIYSTNREEKLN